MRRAGDDHVAKAKIEKAMIKAIHSMRVNVAKWSAAETFDDALARLSTAEAQQAHGAAPLRSVRAGCLLRASRTSRSAASSHSTAG